MSNDETVAVWDAETGQRIHRLEGHFGSVLGVSFGADGTTLYTSAADGSLIRWDIAGAGGVARRVLESTLPVGLGATVRISPTATSVVVLRPGDERILELDAGGSVLLRGDGNAMWGDYSPDGEQFVTVGWDGTLELFDISDGELLTSRPGRGVENRGAVAFTADGSAVVVADADGIVTEHDAVTLEPTGRAVDVGVEPVGIRTAAGGLIAATAAGRSEETEVVFADLNEGRILRRVHVAVPLARANFSVDGSMYALGGFDGRLRIVDVSSGEVVGPEDPIHSGPIAWVAFSPDGATLATFGSDGELAIVDTSTAVPRARARPGPANHAASVGFQPDGESVLVAYEDGSVIQFATDPDAWIDHACRVAGRNLTEHEWRDAFGDGPYRETCPTNA